MRQDGRLKLPGDILQTIAFFLLQAPSLTIANYYGISVSTVFRRITVACLQSLSTIIVGEDVIYMSGNVPYLGFVGLRFDMMDTGNFNAFRRLYEMHSVHIFRFKIRHMTLDSFNRISSPAFLILRRLSGIRHLTLPPAVLSNGLLWSVVVHIRDNTGWSLEQIDNYPLRAFWHSPYTLKKRIEKGILPDGTKHSFEGLQKLYWKDHDRPHTWPNEPVYFTLLARPPSPPPPRTLR